MPKHIFYNLSFTTIITTKNHVVKPLCPTTQIDFGWSITGANHYANTSGYNPLQAHYGDFVVADNSGPIFLFFFPILVAQNYFRAWLKIVHFTFSNHLGGFPNGYSNVNVLQQHTFNEKNHTSCLSQV
jgi:hypothetical protein